MMMKRMMILLLAAMMCLLTAPAMAEASDMVEEVLFDDSAAVTGSWKLATGVNTTNAHGPFDPLLITPGGSFVVEYTGVEKMVYLALSEWDAGVWAQVNEPADCTTQDGVHRAVFTYDQCVTAYGGKDFSEVDQVCVGSTNAEGETVIRRILWQGKPLVDELGADAVLFRGAASASAANSNLAFVFTRHVGGEFDAAAINPGSSFYVEYTGPRNGVYLAFSSHSGAEHWKRVDADEVKDLGDGRYAATFRYANFSRVWGTNFARLDQLTVFTAAAGQVKLHKVAYFAGEGDPADSTDGRWDRPEQGIAFIGDSICQNAQLIYGDWNTILGRSDCMNFGIGGQTTRECLARIDELASRDLDMVVFICGINDIGRGYTNEEIVGNFDAMMNAIRAKNADCRYLLVSVLPTTSAFYNGQQHRIVALNDAYAAYAAQHDDVTFVNVYPSFTAAPGEYAYPELLSDGLHPNDKGYAAIAEVLVQYLPESK